MTQIIERPIIFSAQNVLRILANEKTQTRRVIKPQPEPCTDLPGRAWYQRNKRLLWCDYTHERFLEKCPYGQPGDMLWVREACYIWGHWRKNGLTKTGRQRWRFVANTPHAVIFDSKHPQVGNKNCNRESRMYWRRPSIFMPRWASRITLRITDVRVQRIQDISEEDALAEGVDFWYVGDDQRQQRGAAFRDLWDSINAERGYPWEANPWVWPLTFEREEGAEDREQGAGDVGGGGVARS